MPITYLMPIAAGNAVRVHYERPAGAIDCVLLRNTTGVFAGHNDPNSVLVAQDFGDMVVDAYGLENGQAYHYQTYWTPDGLVWTPETSGSVTPATNFLLNDVDPQIIVRDRLDLGMQALIASGGITHPNGRIHVLTAPPLFEDVAFPAVTVHLTADRPGDRFVGEDLAENMPWDEFEGWLSSVTLSIVGWSLNPDERIVLRRAIKHVIQANLGLFDAYGLVQVDFSQTDSDDFQSFNAPVYQTVGTFSCLVQADVHASQSLLISAVPVTVNAIP